MLRHNQKLGNTLVILNGGISVKIPNAIVWIDEHYIDIARYGENLPTISFENPTNLIEQEPTSDKFDIVLVQQ